MLSPFTRQFSTGLRTNIFFSNANLSSARYAKGLQKTITPRVTILKSAFGPNFNRQFTYFKKTIISQFNGNGIRRSTTWNNYNKYHNRSNWDRLKKPFIFTVAFSVATTVVTPYLFDYTPMKYFKRNSRALVWSIVALNAVVFLMWKVPSLQRYTMQYGIMFKDNLQSVWTMLGSAFSHQSFGHILVNMFALQSFGTTLCAVLGAANFTILYLNSAVISSFAALAIPTLMRSSLSFASLGASGAVFSVFAAFSYLIPKAPIALFFFPIPGGAWMLFLGTFVWNVAGVVLRWGVYDYAAHIGGSLVGLAYAYWYNIKRKEELRRRQIRWF